MTNERLCCISSVTLVARFIGIFDLIISIIAIYYLTEDFFIDKKGLIISDDIRTIFNFSWTNSWTVKNSENKLDDTSIFFYLIIYSTLHFISSIGLILATIFRKKNYTLPWLTLEIINLANQASAVILIIFHKRCEHDEVSPSFLLACFYLLIGIYSWIIVFVAQKSWPELSSENLNESNDEEISNTIDIESPKPLIS